MTLRARVFLVFICWLASLFLGCVGATGDGGYGNTPLNTTDTQSQTPDNSVQAPGVTCNNTGQTPLLCADTPAPIGDTEYCPFTGHTNANQDSFSCTTCPQGINWLSGTWMFFQKEPGDAPFVDILEVKGNHFTETLIGEDDVLAPGVETTAVLKGYYFCPSKDDYASLRKIFVIESVEPQNGLFGNHVGDSYPCDVLGNGSGSSFLLWCDYGWTGNPPLTTQFEYCRDGATIDEVQCVIPNL